MLKKLIGLLLLIILSFLIILSIYFKDREHYWVKSFHEITEEYATENEYQVVTEYNVPYQPIQLNLYNKIKWIKLKFLNKQKPYNTNYTLKSKKNTSSIQLKLICMGDHVKFIEICYSNMSHQSIINLKNYFITKTNYQDIFWTKK